MDTRFAIAIHLLILITESETPMSSAQMAESVGTNPSFVRKILGALKHAGIIDSRRGATGFTLSVPASKITLLWVYEAIYETSKVALFCMHKNPNDECLVGRYIKPTLDEVFGKVESDARARMEKTTLAECIGDMRSLIECDSDTAHRA